MIPYLLAGMALLFSGLILLVGVLQDHFFEVPPGTFVLAAHPGDVHRSTGYFGVEEAMSDEMDLLDEDMTPEKGYQLAVEWLKTSAGFAREKLNEGVSPVELANRVALGLMQSQDATVLASMPGLLGTALVLFAANGYFDE